MEGKKVRGWIEDARRSGALMHCPSCAQEFIIGYSISIPDNVGAIVAIAVRKKDIFPVSVENVEEGLRNESIVAVEIDGTRRQ